MCERNLIEACATIGDWAFIVFAHCKYCAAIRDCATIGDLGYY